MSDTSADDDQSLQAAFIKFVDAFTDLCMEMDPEEFDTLLDADDWWEQQLRDWKP